MSQTTTIQVSAPATTVFTGIDTNASAPGVHNNTFGGFEHPHPIPTFTCLNAHRDWMLQHMAGAFRVFARKGFTEGTAGHISVRDPVDPNTFWINPLCRHFAMLKASDMVHVDENGKVLPDGNQAAVNAAGFRIHSQLHKARPDINAACHTHSVYGKAYSAFGKPIEMLNQDACTFYNSHSVYEGFGGIVLDDEEGKQIATALKDNKAVILQNHGLLTVGGTVDEAAYLFTLLERCCETQLAADSVHPENKSKITVGDEEAQYTFEMTSDPESLYAEFQPDFEYEIWKSNGELKPF
ncbi:putative class II aldolase/adducin domain protein [Nadsonia fulvescens var. elongata DSM 6958]|uniref:Putative class II aldolase/adducin domain protein n=1 Tax=Nadsonia fulvescens var. elongata DSM 6958 TaxID=857566 RepID=A0A1E3PRM7_9ASCO|nr:putative class II aldolase/adducin domain protein [Nadsonia fulvescens var. elongata DSM 6958]